MKELELAEKKVNPLKDGSYILIEMIKLFFFKSKI